MINGTDLGLIIGALAALSYIGFVIWFNWRLLVYYVRPSTEGTIVQVAIKETHDDQGGTIYYVPKVAYSYAVDGRIYHSDRFWMTESLYVDGPLGAKRQLGDLTRGTRVRVSYDPRNPQVAFVKVEASDLWFFWLSWLFPALFVVLLAFLILVCQLDASVTSKFIGMLTLALAAIAPLLSVAIYAIVVVPSSIKPMVTLVRERSYAWLTAHLSPSHHDPVTKE